MFELDCSSGEKALASLSFGFQCTIEELKEVLFSLDLDGLYEEFQSAPQIPTEQYLYEQVIESLGEPLPLSSVVWFHCTRTCPDTDFSEGIAPLNDSLGRVWEIILRYAPEEYVRQSLLAMKESGVKDELYTLRTQDSIHWGPFGILVRDVAFVAEDLGQHDYLKMPELVEDICNAYQVVHGVALHGHYSQVLKPKIVKFRSESRLDSGCLESALGYAYRYIRGCDPDGMSITGIDCEGAIVSPHQIIETETMEP
ncbi:hypothetical protein EHLJMEHL_00474 [Vreelandella titanicae]